MIALVDADAYLNSCAWEAQELSEAQEKFDETVENLTAEAFADEWVGALGGDTNFREFVFPDYKQSVTRKKSRDKRQDWFPDLKDWISEKPNVIRTEWCEADDYLAQWSSELRNAGIDCIVVTSDKDLLTVPGKIYSPAAKKYFGAEGNLKSISEKEAFWFFCFQMLMGDSTDHIPGIPGTGPVKAGKLLEGLRPKQQAHLVKRFYESHYDIHWKDYFLSNGKMLHMRRHPSDWFTEPLFDERAEVAEREVNPDGC